MSDFANANFLKTNSQVSSIGECLSSGIFNIQRLGTHNGGNRALRIWVVIATVGRASLLRQTLARLPLQTRAPDGILVVGSSPEDIEGAEEACDGVQAILSEKGLCRQRNRALERLREESDVVVFFDDDFLPEAHYLETLVELFDADPELVGLTGLLYADGAHTGQIAFADATEMLARDIRQPVNDEHDCDWLYGCNMAFRTSATTGLSFDEALPLYGWQEDVDFSNQVARRGKMIRSNALTGIHLGTRGGRQSGLKLGYSQVANIIYLLRKGTIGRWHGVSLMTRNILANCVKCVRPEPEIDRRGRLAGNLLAAGDLLRGRVTPERIELL